MFRQLVILWDKLIGWLAHIFNESDEYELPPYREVRNMPLSEIVPREEWGAREPEEELSDLDIPVTAVVFHHTRTPQCHSKEECSKVIRSIQDLHMGEYHWPDIGYNFLIGGDARVYEGTGWYKKGSHTDGWNEKSIGVAAIGDFKEEPPSEEMLEAIEQLVGTGLKGKYLRHDYSALGHNQLDIVWNNYVCTCPGDAFYEEVKDMPHWTIGGDLIEAKEPDSDTFDSRASTEFFYTSELDTEKDYPKGYDEDVYGPTEVK